MSSRPPFRYQYGWVEAEPLASSLSAAASRRSIQTGICLASGRSSVIVRRLLGFVARMGVLGEFLEGTLVHELDCVRVEQ